MSVQKAIQVEGVGIAQLVNNRPIPKLRDDYILVKTAAVALNPTDWKHIDHSATPGALVGCDFSGTVEEVGKSVKKAFKKGDRICGFTHGSNNSQLEDGAFAEYIVVKGDLQLPIPPQMSFEDAATLGVGIHTVGQGLYQSLKLPLPSEPAKEPQPILIYGGSTATGTIAIQFAKLSGWEVITTCSPRNFELVKSLGADAVFDYNDPDSGSKIREYTKDKLTHVFDCIAEESSFALCANALSSKPGGEYSGLLKVKDFPREDVNTRHTLAYTTSGEAFRQGPEGPIMEAKPEDFDHAEKFAELASALLAEGKIKVHPALVNEGGLAGVLVGLDLLKNGKVSGGKLVYRVSD